MILNNLESQGELSQLIQNFDKISIKEIDPIVLTNEREKHLFEKGFHVIVDDINDLIYRLLNKGIEWQSLEDNVIDYLNDHDIELREIYNWLLNNQNNSNSIFLLGYINHRGIEINVNLKKAFNLFINASEKNHIPAQYFAGNCYEYGSGTIKNEKLAFEYIEKSANKNLAHGQFEIGYLYEIGFGIEKDSEKAFYWYEKAANNGNIAAMLNLGNCYRNGVGVETDYDKAFELYKQSAEGGHSGGITMVGFCYFHGIGTKIDKQKAFELYHESAFLGNMIAQYNLGILYEEGKGITKDIDEAIYWYEKSSDQGYQYAQNKLDVLKISLITDNRFQLEFRQMGQCVLVAVKTKEKSHQET
ncbi:kinase-like domain-containing protein [Rhizophagus clarus]|uniref:Kinase-like domain-containing protein n=1 Tax=Rhizophagus clarus TaxID=94130 RepID=A0A8H3R5X2_9GLOM|nr:kinase-like domain-containing protein [Rhizophagus clarus]